MNVKQFDKLCNEPEWLREISIEAYDLADNIEQLITLGFMKILPKFVYNGGRQYKVLAIWD